MKAFVFSIGEKTTDLCCELMEQYGFDVVLYKDNTSLWYKLKRFYTEALESDDEWFVRIDADIIPNRNVIELAKITHDTPLWTCAVGYDWYKQDRGAISVHVMHRSIIRLCLDAIDEAEELSRPETHMWRLRDVNRHTHIRSDISCGIHGYGQTEHRKRIQELKHVRGQKYDWGLLDKIEALQ